MARRAWAVLLIAISGSALSASAPNATELLTQAQNLHHSGKAAEARPLYVESLKAYAESLKAAAPSREDSTRAAALLGLAQIDLSAGKYALAISEGEAAVSGFHAANDKKTEGSALTTVGQARYFSGDTSGALHDFHSSLVLAREAHDVPSEITSLNNVGGVYFAQGRFGEAFEQYQAAETRLHTASSQPWFASREQLTLANLAVLYQGIGEYRRALEQYRAMAADPKALPARELAQLLANKGTLYRRLGDPVTALEQYRAAQQLYRAAALTSGELSVLNNIGIDYALDLMDYPAAIAAFTSALQLAGESGARRSAMTSLLYRGEALLRTNKISAAAKDFRAALENANELSADEEKWRALYGLARIAAVRGDRAGSDNDLRRAIATIERMRTTTSAGSGRTGFLIERRDVYDALIEHLAEQATPDPNELFRLMERSRARDLQDRLQSHPLSLDQLRAALPAGTLLIEYWTAQSALAAIAVSRDKAELVFKRLDAAEESSLRTLPSVLRDPDRSDWRKPAQIAAALLTGHIALLQSQRLGKLLIVPDSYLGRMPFEALAAGDGLLIDRFSISYLPFASAFQKPAPRRFAFPWSKTLEAFANPQSAKTAAAALKEETDGAIPDSSREVQNAAAAVGGGAELFLGRDARKSVLTASAMTISVLHLATHAFADQEDPARSYILFAGDKTGFDYLFLKEAEELKNVRGSLVVVSACDSGEGKIERGEGIQSFGSAFLAAGAKTVVTSLWRVGDRPSAELMTRFYERLSAGDDASDALRNAKLSFRRATGSASHPAYWAAFAVAGDGGLKLPQVISSAWIASAILAAIVSLIAFVRTTAGKA